MKAAVYYQNDHIEIQEMEPPSIDDGELLIKVKACGICVADTMEWYQKPKAPIILGHEVTGIVAEVGEGVKGFQKGDRIVAHHHVACMHCEYCNHGDYTLCQSFKKSNYRPGGFSEYIALSPQHVTMDTLLLPNSVSFDAGTLVEPLACVIHAIRKMNIKPDDRSVIVGTGSIGIMFAQVLKAYGVRNILAFETNDWRAEKARCVTQVEVLHPKEDAKDNAEAYRIKTGFMGADKVFVIAKDLRAMELGIAMANPGGTVMLFASPAKDEYLKFYVSEAFFKELTIKLSYSANHLDTREALALIEKKQVDSDSLITHRFSLENLSEGILQTASRGKALKCIVVL